MQTPAPDPSDRNDNRYGLIAMPDPRTRSFCEDVLEASGLRSVTAEDGLGALQVLDEKGAPAILITALSMPRGDGFVLLEELRRRHDATVTPAIVVSAFSELRGAAAQLQDKLGIAWILAKDSSELFVRHAIQQSLEGASDFDVELPPVRRHKDPARNGRMREMGIVDEGPQDAILETIVTGTARKFGVPVALVSLVLDDKQWFKAHFGLGGELLTKRSTPVDQAFCRHVVDAGESLVVPDASTHPYFSGNELVVQGIVGSYAGAPLITSSGEVLGTLCIIDNKPLSIDARKVRALESLARRVAGEIQLKSAHPQSAKPAAPPVTSGRRTLPTSVQAVLSLMGGSATGNDQGVLLFDVDLRVCFAGKVVEAILGLAVSSMIGMTRDDILQRASERVADPMELLIRLQMPDSGAFAYRGDFVLRGNRNRRMRWIEEAVPLDEGAGQLCVLKTIGHGERPAPARSTPSPRSAPEPFAERSQEDSLSGIVLREIVRTRDQGVPMSFALFRVSQDNEDAPAAGASLFEVLKESMSSTDLLLRWGPREYLVGLPRTRAGDAQSFVNYVGRSIHAHNPALRIASDSTELAADEEFHTTVLRLEAMVRKERAAARP